MAIELGLTRAISLAVVSGLWLAGAAGADGDAGNLLATADPVGETVTLLSPQDLASLLDNDPATTASWPVTDDRPIDLIFQLEGEMAAPERLQIVLSGTDAGQAPVSVDLLVSVVSASVGFSSVRTESIDGLSPRLDLRFDPIAAGWAMIRLVPAPGANRVTLADLTLLGQPGPPQSAYAFDQSPAEAIALIQSLGDLGADGMALSQDEADLFALTEGGLTVAEFEEIALHASGVTASEDRARYATRIAALEAKVRAEIDLGGTPSATGGALLDWLHDDLLSGGYQEGQTNLSDLLDSGVYNCVSSAVIYAALGQRLGLDVRGIEVPDHAFAILYDGADHSDVETTTAQGFDPSRERRAAFEQLTGYTYIPQSNKAKRREIDLAGLAALIYYNHGVFALRDGRYADALIANFRALSLDPEFDSAIKNALAALGNWSLDLAEAGRWEDAARTAGIGVSLAPDDRGLAARQNTVWRRWSTALANDGDLAGALAVLRRAEQQIAGADFADAQAYLFIRQGEALIGAGNWDAALLAADPGDHPLSGAARESLDDWRRDVYLRWSNAALDAGDFASANAVLGAGLVAFPGDSRIGRNLRYVAQEGAAAAPTYDDGLAFLARMLAAYPTLDRLEDTAEAYVARAALSPEKAPDIASGIAMVDRAADLFSDSGVVQDLGARVYERHGHALIDAADWPAAAEIYAAGRAAYPEARILTRNARYVAQNWQRQALESGGPEALAEVNARLRRLFPDFADDGFGENEVRRQVADLADAGSIAEAQAALDAAQLVLSADTYQEMSVYIIDRDARQSMEARDWAVAAEVYASGLANFPGDRHLAQNAAYVAQEWTRDAAADGGPAALSEVMARLEVLFPGNDRIAEMGLNTLRRALAQALESGQVSEARAMVADARPTLSAADAEDLTVTMFSLLAQRHLDARDWPAAMEAYAQGRRLYPDARSLSRNVPYIVQEWVRDAYGAGGVPALLEAAATLRDQGVDARDLARTVEALIGREAERILGDGDADTALTLIDATAAAMPDDTVIDLKAYVYDRWARQVGEAGDWPGAIAIYDAGLAELGDVRILTNNRRWAESQ